MFEDDLKQWERRHPGSISHFLSLNNLLHYEFNCAGTHPQWVPGDVVQELWRLGRHQLRFIGWCEKCAVKRREVKHMSEGPHERPMVQALPAPKVVRDALPKTTGKDTGEAKKDQNAGKEVKAR